MMKNLIKTLGFILAVVGPSVAMAAPRTDNPQTTTTTDPNKIINTVCIESDQIPGGKKCDNATNTIIDDSYACFSISSTGSVVEVGSDGKGNMKFRCEASSAGTHRFHFDCGNGITQDKTGNNGYAEYICQYTGASVGDILTASCTVDGEPTNPSCTKKISIGVPPLSDCGNGVIELNEDCDFKGMSDYWWKLYPITNYLDTNQQVEAGDFNTAHGYYCRNCSLVYSGSTGTNFVYEPIECHSVDKPISVMNSEIIPFWWRLNMHNDTMTVTDDESMCADRTDDQGTLIRPRNCYFAVYNGNHKQGDDEGAIQTFNIDCYNNNFNEYDIYKYFKKTHETLADGASVSTVHAYTNGLSEDEFGEYKFVLEQVNYDVCEPGEGQTPGKRISGKRSGPVCEVNAAITRPYAMQISTFGANPIGATDKDFLYDYYDMYGNSILDSTDLRWTMNISSGTYAYEGNLEDEIQKFRDKYEKLAVKVNGNFKIKAGMTIDSVFGGNVQEIRKVPNKHIYFVKGSGKLQLKQDEIGSVTSAYTIFVDGMDVVIEGDVLQYAMIITTKQIIFKDGGPKSAKDEQIMSCAEGGQVVQGLFVAQDGFKSDDPTWNINPGDLWCPWGGLHVKGALMGPGINTLMEGKRSQLNSWFNINNYSKIKKERREKIIGGAAVLIEYSPSLWKILPPGAEMFTESLEVYRR